MLPVFLLTRVPVAGVYAALVFAGVVEAEHPQRLEGAAHRPRRRGPVARQDPYVLCENVHYVCRARLKGGPQVA